MPTKQMQTYLCSYWHDGRQWSLELKATSPQDAKERLAKMAWASVDGVMVAVVPVGLGWLSRGFIRLMNWRQK